MEKKLICVGEKKGWKLSWILLINGEAQIIAGRMENFLKINKRVYPSIWDLRVSTLSKGISPFFNYSFTNIFLVPGNRWINSCESSTWPVGSGHSIPYVLHVILQAIMPTCLFESRPLRPLRLLPACFFPPVHNSLIHRPCREWPPMTSLSRLHRQVHGDSL